MIFHSKWLENYVYYKIIITFFANFFFWRVFFLYGPIEFEEFLNGFICPIDGILTISTALNHIGPGSNYDEEVLHTLQMSWTRA